jgi:hypothetical protein
MLVGYSVKLASIILLYLYMWSENKKRDREAANAPVTSEAQAQDAIERGMLVSSESRKRVSSGDRLIDEKK